MRIEDVTYDVDFTNPDDEYMPIIQCVCGEKFPNWHYVISIYPDNAHECPYCGAKLYFRQSIRVYQVIEE